MQPPIHELPEGEWYCPLCQNTVQEEMMAPVPLEMVVDDDPQQAEGSPMALAPRWKGGSKKKGLVVEEEEEEEEEEVEVEVSIEDSAALTPGSNRGRPRGSEKKRAGRQRPGAEKEEEEEMDDIPIAPAPRSRKRKRGRKWESSSPGAIPRVRLRLPTTTTTTTRQGKDREEPEENVGMFDGILSEMDRDTSKTTVTKGDQAMFERSRVEAEKKVVLAAAGMSPMTNWEGGLRPTRSSTVQQMQHEVEAGPWVSGGGVTARKDPETLRIKTIRFGPYDIKTWYDAPFPEEYGSIPDGRLWICEFCLKYMKSRFQGMRHRLKCKARHPPGDEIYRDGMISLFEVDGRKNKVSGVCWWRQGIETRTDLLSKLVSVVQDVSGPQIAVLRCGAVSVLCDDGGGREGSAVCGLL